MKFERAHVYGFGKWIDHTIQFTDQNLLCLYGENESGKSTLKNFFMFMLFGFPPKRRKYYQPKMSSRMGGRLIIYEADIGTYTIERMDGVRNGAAICYLSDGEERDEQWLKERLDGMTATTYEAIHSFSALDLVNIKQMKDEDLGEILLNIGLTGYNNIYEIEQQLNRELDELFKPYGKIPTINEQLNVLDDRSIQLTTIKNEAMTYRDQRVASEKLRDELQQLRDHLFIEQKNKLAIEKHLNSLPLIHDYFAYQRQLASLSETITFPEKGVERLRIVQEQLLPIKSEHSVLIDKENQLTKIIEQTEQQLLKTAFYDEANDTIRQEFVYRRNEDELSHNQQKINKLQLQMTSKLEQLQIGIQAEHLDMMNFPFHIEQQWITYKQNSNELNRLNEQVTKEHQTLMKQYDALVSELDHIKKQLLPEEQRNNTERNIKKFNLYREQEQMRNETIQKQKQWNQHRGQKKKEQTMILLTSIFLSLLPGGIAYFSNIPFLYNLMIFIILFGFGQWIWGKRSLRETDKIIDSNDTTIPVETTLSEEEKQLAEQTLAKDEELKESYLMAEKELRQIDLHILSSTEKKATITRDVKNLDKQIAEHRHVYPFLQNMDVAYWPELFHPVRHIVGMQRETIELTEKIATIKSEQNGMIENMDHLLKKIDSEYLHLSSFKKYELIKEVIQSHDDALRHINQCKEDLRRNKQQQREKRQEIKIYNEQISSLFAIAHVHSEEEYYASEKEYAHKQQTETSLNKVIEQLQTVFTEKEFTNLRQEDNKNHDQLKLQLQTTNEQVRLLTEKIEEKREQQAALQATLQKMESSETFSDATHRYSLEEEQLHVLAKKWAVLKTARDVLAQTKRSYRNDYLSRVIDQMTTFFQKLTGNAYVQVFAPTEDRLFQVESAQGIRYTANELSQGTIDQLYVSLRIAMGQMVSKQHNLPFIIDDAFVHFDSIRLKRMLDIISSVAHHQQVIVFTCKKEIVNYLQLDHVVYLDKPATVRINE